MRLLCRKGRPREREGRPPGRVVDSISADVSSCPGTKRRRFSHQQRQTQLTKGDSRWQILLNEYHFLKNFITYINILKQWIQHFSCFSPTMAPAATRGGARGSWPARGAGWHWADCWNYAFKSTRYKHEAKIRNSMLLLCNQILDVNNQE